MKEGEGSEIEKSRRYQAVVSLLTGLGVGGDATRDAWDYEIKSAKIVVGENANVLQIMVHQ